ncbi:MAG: sulfite exporter TauE/SafE family protein [Deltaproteobacteria bacterium]|nr:sulfite exporter TauE/SafE family protein [Deltaproteobacteria bacterium]
MVFDGTTLLIGLALLIAAFVKGTTGLGFPLIATPTVALILDIRTAVTILIIPNIVMDIAQVFRGSFPAEILRRFVWLILLTIVGVFLGTSLLVVLPLWVLNLSLGIMVLTFVTSNLLRLNFQIPPHLEGVLSPVVGVIGGFLNGMTNAAGPALAIYLYSLKLPKKEFIKSIATIFIVTKVTQLVAVSTWNLFTPSRILLSLEVTLFILAGFYAGLKTQDRVNQKTFNRGLLILLSIIGVTLVVRSLI